VHFLGHRSDARQIVASLDFYWHAAAQDAAAAPVLQALAAGIPAVALDTPAHRGLITHGVSGFLVEADDRPSFARWTHKMLEDSTLRQQIASAGQQRVREEFSVEKLVQAYRELYEDLL
jgi:glycosyltransferase involved in cell wall biosynthesis